MDTDARVDLTTRHTQEVVTEEELRELLEDRDQPSAYIGYAPTGEMHIGHFTTMR
ncbi:MAG: tyrosine--tRNA ligase, partial [Halovenus sp.]